MTHFFLSKRTLLLGFLCLITALHPAFAQYVGFTGTGNINLTTYNTLSHAEVLPFASGTTAVTVKGETFYDNGTSDGQTATSGQQTTASLYWAVNGTVANINADGTGGAGWTEVAGSNFVQSGNNDRFDFVITGAPAGTEIMYYLRFAQTSNPANRYLLFSGTAAPHTALPSAQSQLFKLRINQATAYNTQRVDGIIAEWNSTTQVCNRSSAATGRTLDMTWDADNIYFLINSGFTASSGDRILFAFDVNPGAGGNANGTRGGFNGATFPENYRTDILFRVRGSGSNFWTVDRATSDGANGWNYTPDAGNSVVSEVHAAAASGNSNLEVRISRAALGTFTDLGIYVWFGNISDMLYDSYPHGNPNTTPAGRMAIRLDLASLSNGLSVPAAVGFSGHYIDAGFTLFGSTTYRDLRISNAVNALAASDLTVTGNLQIDAGGSFTLSGTTGNDVYLAGNFTNNGTLSDNTRAVFFNGAADQTLGGSTPTAFSYLIAEKTGGDIRLLNHISVNSQVDLDNPVNQADIDLNGFNLSLGAAASVAEDLPNNKLITDATATTEANMGGYLAFTRTVTNAATELANTGITLFHTGGSDYAVNVKRYHFAGANNGTGNSTRKVYDITGTPSGTTSLYLKYAADELDNVATADMIYRWEALDGWKKATDPSVGMTVNVVGNEIQATGTLASFSRWTVGDDAMAFPVTLTGFEAERLNSREVILTWATAAEVNNRGFDVEISTDGQQFRQADFVAAAGPGSYEWVGQVSHDAWFRLKQVDTDGAFAYSHTAFVAGADTRPVTVAPNPAKGTLTVDFGPGNATLMLFAPDGREVWNQQAAQTPAVLVMDLPAGIYFLHVVQQGVKTVMPVVIE